MCASLKTNLNERTSVVYFVAILAPFKHRCSVLKLTSLVVKLYLNLAAMRKLILCCLIAATVDEGRSGGILDTFHNLLDKACAELDDARKN